MKRVREDNQPAVQASKSAHCTPLMRRQTIRPTNTQVLAMHAANIHQSMPHGIAAHAPKSPLKITMPFFGH
jgi:hypothetical protein